jgi:hypothetical protein
VRDGDEMGKKKDIFVHDQGRLLRNATQNKIIVRFSPRPRVIDVNDTGEK